MRSLCSRNSMLTNICELERIDTAEESLLMEDIGLDSRLMIKTCYVSERGKC